jgi:hypothetical protein
MSANSPRNAEVITPSDTVPLPSATTWIMVGTGGTLTIDTPGGQTKVAMTVPAGMWPIAAKKVWATGTGAINLTGFWD